MKSSWTDQVVLDPGDAAVENGNVDLPRLLHVREGRLSSMGRELLLPAVMK